MKETHVALAGEKRSGVLALARIIYLLVLIYSCN